MKKILPTLFLTSLLAMPVLVAAVGEAPGEGAPEIVRSAAELIALIERIGDWIFGLLLVIAAIMLVVSGFFFITAAGSAEKVGTARTMLINALIGVAVALAAKGLVMVVRSILGG